MCVADVQGVCTTVTCVVHVFRVPLIQMSAICTLQGVDKLTIHIIIKQIRTCTLRYSTV